MARDRGGQVGVLAQKPACAATGFALGAGMRGSGNEDALGPERFGSRRDAVGNPARGAIITAGVEMHAADAEKQQVP